MNFNIKYFLKILVPNRSNLFYLILILKKIHGYECTYQSWALSTAFKTTRQCRKTQKLSNFRASGQFSKGKKLSLAALSLNILWGFRGPEICRVSKKPHSVVAVSGS